MSALIFDLAEARSRSRAAQLFPHPPPHLDPAAPVNADTVGRLLAENRDDTPLSELLWIGGLQIRMKGGSKPTPEDEARVRRIRRAIMKAAWSPPQSAQPELFAGLDGGAE